MDFDVTVSRCLPSAPGVALFIGRAKPENMGMMLQPLMRYIII